MLLKIAWRNIWRNPLRSSVIILSITIGIWAGGFILAFVGGMMNEQISTAVSRQLSHIQVHHSDYKQEEDLKYLIPKGSEVITNLKQRPEVKGVSGRIRVNAMASTAHGSAGVILFGIDHEDEAAVTGLDNYLAEGKYFDTGMRNTVIIGTKLKEKLQVNTGQKVVFTFQNSADELTAVALRVAAVYNGNNSVVEETIVYVPANELATVASISTTTVHEIAVLLSGNDQLETTAASIRKNYPALQVETWKQLSPELRLVIDSFNEYMTIIMGLILMALVFGIINTMLMAVLERQHELGVLMAVGMNRSKVFFMIVFETMLMTLAACAIGLPASWATIAYFGKHGIDLSNWSQGLAQYGIRTMVYPALELQYFVKIGAMSIASSMLAAIYPARKSLQLKPVEAIRKI
jgi:ABC-type lipoprotein release transport system permease subunit